MKVRFITIAIFITLMYSCSSDEYSPSEKNIIDFDKINGPKYGNLTINHKDKADDDLLLIQDINNGVFLINKRSEKIFEWNLDNAIGNDVELLDDGRLFGAFKTEPSSKFAGGQGGKIMFINPDNSIDWEYELSTNSIIAHHDVELLPNGNILILAWERKIEQVAVEAGYFKSQSLIPEYMVEINYETKETVWEWHAWDHLIQDFDPTKDNYGVISEHPELININYVKDKGEDIMHANGIEYDPENDLIYMSVNFYSEIWVIDHSTSTTEAASSLGGNYNKGGNLIYRFGNPLAYDNVNGNKLFHNNHHPNLLSNTPTRNMLIFSNGNHINQSTVYELELPNEYNLFPNNIHEPKIIWSFTHPELFSGKVSGAVRLSNGNTLITEGDYGIWEVTQNNEIVWKLEAGGFFWRTYSYSKNHEGIIKLFSHK